MLFYDNFDAICRQRGTSANAAAIAIGRSKSAASAWKRNGTLPKEDELIALAKHLRCRVADFFLEDGQTHFKSREDMLEYWEYVNSINPLNVDETFGLGEEEADFVGIYRCCTKRQQAELMVLVYGFADENGIEYEDAQ